MQLFQRINNRLILTHAGEKYVETAKKITEMYTDLEKDLSGINEELSGRLRVGCAVLRLSLIHILAISRSLPKPDSKSTISGIWI